MNELSADNTVRSLESVTSPAVPTSRGDGWLC